MEDNNEFKYLYLNNRKDALLREVRYRLLLQERKPLECTQTVLYILTHSVRNILNPTGER